MVLAGIAAGVIAAISGFGIGSLLTPVLSTQTDLKTAVAAVSIPHFIGTALRLWLLRSRIHLKLRCHERSRRARRSDAADTLLERGVDHCLWCASRACGGLRAHRSQPALAPARLGGMGGVVGGPGVTVVGGGANIFTPLG